MQTIDINTIPPITDPKGRYWDQPPTKDVLVDDNCALMSKKTFETLPEYSTSTPTGVYPGKMWRARRGPKWYLRWYGLDDGHPDGLPTPSREIVLI